MSDLVTGPPILYPPSSILPPSPPAGGVCFGAGAGGSLVIADVDRRLTFAYVMNKMVPSLVATPITAALVEQLYDIVKR